MKNIITRSISGIVYVALIVCAFLSGPQWFMALMALFALLAVREFQLLTGNGKTTDVINLAISTVDIAAAVALCLVSTSLVNSLFYDGIILASYIILRIVLAVYDRRPDVFVATAKSVLSVIYIGLPLSLASLTAKSTWMHPQSHYLALIMFIMIWLNDTGAYCVGCSIGRHRLFPRLSPKKSWEGFWGGMLFCIGAGAACYAALGHSAGESVDWTSLSTWIGFGIMVSVFSTWGDLFESLIKRSLGVKDSGRLIPGHGGILDRIDSLLLVAPATFIYAFLTGLF